MAQRKTGATVNQGETQKNKSDKNILIDNGELSVSEQEELDGERAAAGGNLQQRTQSPKELPSERKVRLMLEGSAPKAISHPNVRGGICDFCGIIDPKQPSHTQYLLCKHYKDLSDVESVPGYKGLRCSYCPQGLSALDLQDIILKRVIQVKELVERPGELICVCDDLRCRDKHIKRFTVNS